ncbi:SCO family protein [Agaribacter flavus]|uniref:SCO family protein n=1 Tax=Agaribacter flavus TaxID=1902781 RepID=A0ABV7FTV8_9ALTE
MMQKKWVILFGAVALLIGIYLSNATGVKDVAKPLPLSERTQYLHWYPEPRQITEFNITQHNQSPMNKQSLIGKWTLAFVGYTFCPDICPVTLAEINKVYPELKALAADSPLQVWFLSVDPKRDTIERLNEYVSYFNPDFVAATGDHEQLFPLVRSMGMMYSMTTNSDDPNYLVDHSASIVVINPEAKVVGRFKPVHEPGKIATSDMQQILNDMPLLLSSM